MADVINNQGQVRGTKAANTTADPNPVTIGGTAQALVPTAVSADGNNVAAWYDRFGAQTVGGVVRKATGTIAALNGTAAVSTFGCATAVFTLAGTWVATLNIQGSNDAGATWQAITLVQPTGGAFGGSIQANGVYLVPCAGFDQVQLIAAAYTSGTATVTWEAALAPQCLYLAHPVPAVNETIYQLTPAGATQTLQIGFLAINATASGDTTLLAAQTGRKIRVLAATFTCSAAVSVAWKSATNLLVPAMAFAANGGMDVNRQPAGYWMQTNATEALIINLSATATVNGALNYILV